MSSTPTEGHKPSTPLLALALPAPENDFSTQDIYRAHLIPRQRQKFLFLKAHSREKGASTPGILHSLEGRAGTGVTVASHVVGPSVPSTRLCRVPLMRTQKAATTFPRVGHDLAAKQQITKTQTYVHVQEKTKDGSQNHFLEVHSALFPGVANTF